MTEIVVTDKNNTVVVDAPVVAVITSGMIQPISASSITNSTDVDMSNLQDGGVLVYDSATQKWTATNKFEKQIFEAGQF
jgi:phage baseplate assembly protein gpV